MKDNNNTNTFQLESTQFQAIAEPVNGDATRAQRADHQAALKAAALSYIEAGYCLIPIDGRTKQPRNDLLPRDENRKPSVNLLLEPEHRADRETVERWIRAGAQIAVECGKVSGGLLVLDFDVPRFYDAWRELVGELADGLPVQRTGSGGYQVLAFCDDPGSNRKLAWAPDETEETGRTIAIETRGEGGYAVLAPSLHPSGNYYKCIIDDLSKPPRISQARADALIEAARKLDEAPKTWQQIEAEAKVSAAHRPKQRVNVSVIDAYNAAHSIEECLERYGYTRRGERYVRPGGTNGTVVLLDGKSYHHGSNDPLSQGHLQTAFSVFCHYEHGGDVKVAVKQAALELGMTYSAPTQGDDDDNEDNGTDHDDGHSESAGRNTQSTMLVSLARSGGNRSTGGGEGDSDAGNGIELFCTPAGESYITIRTNGYPETYKLRSSHVRRWLCRLFYLSEGKTPSEQSVKDALRVLEGFALFEGEEHEVFLRIAEYDGKIYLDLGDREWQVVEISTSGWGVISNPPVKFRRARGMLALPAPVAGGNINELRPFLNIASDSDFYLIVGWLLGCLRCGQPLAGLTLNGEQGSCKSTVSKMLRELIDPNEAPVRREPKEPRDLAIAANNSYVIAFDNLSGMLRWLSDYLCCLATGAGFVTRQLHTDDEEMIFAAMRPFLLNGINEIVIASDLLDRTILVTLPRITEENRKTERELWSDFDEVRPRILGALLDAAVAGLNNLPHTHLSRLPRMADFARWVTACEAGLGWEPGSFLNAYTHNRAEANTIAMEASIIASLLRELVEEKSEWSGSASQLLDELKTRVEADGKNDIMRQRDWPKNARALSTHLRRIAPNLRAEGIYVDELGRHSTTGTKQWLLCSSTSKPWTEAKNANNAKNGESSLFELLDTESTPTCDEANGTHESPAEDNSRDFALFASVASDTASACEAWHDEFDTGAPDYTADDPFADD